MSLPEHFYNQMTYSSILQQPVTGLARIIFPIRQVNAPPLVQLFSLHESLSWRTYGCVKIIQKMSETTI